MRGLARELGIPRALLSVDRPDNWPLSAAFPFWRTPGTFP
jgi:hypothetical protein